MAVIEAAPPTETLPCEQATLEWVNEIREQYNIGPALDELPKGMPSVTSACPIARALHSMSAGYFDIALDHFEDPDDAFELETPSFVAHFMRDFDMGKIPHLLDDQYLTAKQLADELEDRADLDYDDPN